MSTQPNAADRDRVRALVSRRRFTAIGWTEQDWDDLDDLGSWAGVPLGEQLCVRQWLRTPPARFVAPVTPTDVREAFVRYGQRTPRVLTAYAAGASHRFVDAVLAAQSAGSPVVAWAAVQHAGLAESDATGWAATGFLFTTDTTPQSVDIRMIAGRFGYWVEAFGPSAWLYVLAGLDLHEATVLAEAGRTPTDKQLRVMVALNGHTLPDGI